VARAWCRSALCQWYFWLTAARKARANTRLTRQSKTRRKFKSPFWRADDGGISPFSGCAQRRQRRVIWDSEVLVAAHVVSREGEE
jgi:hypothetical protein